MSDCPTPKKLSFRDRIQAELFRTRPSAKHDQISYQCPCGRWHLKTPKRPGKCGATFTWNSKLKAWLLTGDAPK